MGSDGTQEGDGVRPAVLEWLDSSGLANERAALLVEHGVGAIVEPGDGEASGRYGLAVLPGDTLRARQILGLAAVEDDEPDEGALTRSVRGLLVPVLLFMAALVVIPLVAFFVSFKLAGG